MAGCNHTATIRNATSVWRGSDSGARIAQALGMSCSEHPRTTKFYPNETTLWSAMGRAGDLALTTFDFPQPLTLIFTGFHGDKVWGRLEAEPSDPFANSGYSGRTLAEWRLHTGVFNCVVPFWGFRRIREIQPVSYTHLRAHET